MFGIYIHQSSDSEALAIKNSLIGTLKEVCVDFVDLTDFLNL